MSDLPDFLLARITEDEELARAARRAQVPDGAEPWALDWGPGSGVDASIEVTPTRVLAECEAKRQIVSCYQDARRTAEDIRAAFAGDDSPLARAERAGYAATERAWWVAMAVIALPDADHPDYREVWRP